MCVVFEAAFYYRQFSNKGCTFMHWNFRILETKGPKKIEAAASNTARTASFLVSISNSCHGVIQIHCLIASIWLEMDHGNHFQDEMEIVRQHSAAVICFCSSLPPLALAEEDWNLASVKPVAIWISDTSSINVGKRCHFPQLEVKVECLSKLKKKPSKHISSCYGFPI